MDESYNSTSLSDNIYQQKVINYKEKALNLLNDPQFSEKELIEYLNEIRIMPTFNIELEDQEKILDENCFEMLANNDINPVFALNLLNVIDIINFIWNVTRKNIDSFHKILLELNIIFSYSFRNEKDETDGIDYALLSTIPLEFYESIVKYGEKCFKKNYNLDNKYLSPDRNMQQIGLAYQENTIVQINSILNKESKETPKIMYYINHNKALMLFEKFVFDSPKNFKQLTCNSNTNNFKGFNEIDFSFVLNEDIEVCQDFIFNKIEENGEIIKTFEPNKGEKIKFPKNANIFIEMKSNLYGFNSMKEIKKISDRIACAYQNTAYNGIEKIFVRKNREYFLLYNNKRSEGLELLKNNRENREIKIIYNSGYVHISSLVSLQNQIKLINNKVDILESKLADIQNNNKKFEEENKKIQEALDKKIQEDKKFKELKLKKKLKKFKASNTAKLELVKIYVERVAEYKMDFNVFKDTNEKIIDICDFLENEIIKISEKIIGKKLIRDKKKIFLNYLDY